MTANALIRDRGLYQRVYPCKWRGMACRSDSHCKKSCCLVKKMFALNTSGEGATLDSNEDYLALRERGCARSSKMLKIALAILN